MIIIQDLWVSFFFLNRKKRILKVTPFQSIRLTNLKRSSPTLKAVFTPRPLFLPLMIIQFISFQQDLPFLILLTGWTHLNELNTGMWLKANVSSSSDGLKQSHFSAEWSRSHKHKVKMGYFWRKLRQFRKGYVWATTVIGAFWKHQD